MGRPRIVRLLVSLTMLGVSATVLTYAGWAFLWPIAADSLGLDPLHGMDLWTVPSDADEDRGRGRVSIAAFSPNGRSLTAQIDLNGESYLSTWSVTDKRLNSRPKWQPPRCDDLLLSSDGAIAVTIDLAESYANGGTPPSVPAHATVWDVATGSELRELTLPTTPIWSAALSADGKALAVGTGDYWNRVPGVVEIWDLEQATRRTVIREETATVTALSFSPDGRYLVVGTGVPHSYPQMTGSLRVLDATSLRELTTLSGHSEGITHTTISADGSTLASLGYQRPVLIWDTATWKLRTKIDESKAKSFSVDAIALSHDGSILATGDTYQVLLWDTRTAEKVGSISIDSPLRSGRNSVFSFGHDDLLALPGSASRGMPFVVDVRSGLRISWELAPAETPTTVPSNKPLTYGQLAVWRRQLKRRISAFDELEPESKKCMLDLAAEVRPGSREADLLEDLGLGSKELLIFIGWKALRWDLAFRERTIDYRMLVFTPTSFVVPPGSPPDTIAILGPDNRLVHWQRIGGGEHGSNSAVLETIDGKTFLSIRHTTRGGTGETARYLVSAKSIEKIYVRPAETLTGPAGELERLGAAVSTDPETTDVTGVSFAQTDITDNDLANVARILDNCRNLESIVLSATKITSAGLKHFAKLRFHSDRELLPSPALMLDGTLIDDAGLEYIQQMTNLRELDLSETPIRGPGLVNLKSFAALTRLSLSNTKLDDIGIGSLPFLQRLEYLAVGGTLISDSNLERLGALERLQHLTLSNTRVAGPGLRYLSGLTDLQTLDLSRTLVTGQGLEHLSNLADLKELRLENTPLTDDGLAELSKLSSLRRLDISHTTIGDVGIAHLRALRRLEYLTVNNTNLTDAGADALFDIPACSYLEVRGTKITESGFDRLRSKRSLQWLNNSEPKQARRD